MNDRAVTILDNYDLQIIRTWKGRSAILCETDQGIKIVKEYNGSKERLYFQKRFLDRISEKNSTVVEKILLNKEGEPFCEDIDRTVYIVKDYFDGRECSMKDEGECLTAVRTLAGLHLDMTLPELAEEISFNRFPLVYEFEKRNKELRKVRRYLKGKGQKTEFERYLQKNYDFFYEKALETADELNQYPIQKWMRELKEDGTFCHGDYQYHNVLFHGEQVSIINFEKAALEDPVRDLYLFTRKLMEKNNWDIRMGLAMLNEYDRIRSISVGEHIQLIYRFRYPEKFWKIVNFYYNNTKAFIPLRNKEKLEKVLLQENAKDEFIENIT